MRLNNFRAILLASAVALQVQAANYYVDFDAGSDANNGTATGTPFQHCPGDANATGTAASTTLAAGDTVHFKGGVTYRGRVSIQTSGTSGSPVTYRTAEGWGSGQAIISGAEVISQSWTNCTGAGDCWDNPNWANIYYTTIPANLTNIFHRLQQDGRMLHISQWPVPSDPYNWDRIDTEWQYPVSLIARTGLTNTGVLTSSDANYYVGSWCGVWVQGNIASLQPITSFVPASDSITFTLFEAADPYTQTNYSRYAILNHPALIDKEGVYAIRTNENRIYVWARGGVDPGTVEIAQSRQKLHFSGNKDYITFSNLCLIGTYAHPHIDHQTEMGGSINVGAYNTGRPGIIVTNCTIRDLSSPEVGGHAVYIYSGGNSFVHGNSFSNSVSRGIIIQAGTNNSIIGNLVEALNGTTMEVWTTTNTLIANNVISRNNGVHANAITAYDGNDTVRITRNKVFTSIRSLTFQNHANIQIDNNIFDGGGYGSVHEWSSTMTGYIYIVNNDFIQGESGLPMLYLGASSATYAVANNIIDGLTGGGSTHTYNIYTEPSYAPTLGTGESTNTIVAILPSYASGVYTPAITISSGYPRNAGTNTSNFGVTTDYSGATRSGTYDIGALEYVDENGVTQFATIGSGVRIKSNRR